LVEVFHFSLLIALVIATLHAISPAVDPFLRGIKNSLRIENDPMPYVTGFLWGVVSSYIGYHFWWQIGVLWREHVMPRTLEIKIVQAISPYFGHKLGWAIRAWRGE